MPSSISELTDLVKNHLPVVVLTGAGISTDSGIAAYRDQTGKWVHAKPVQAKDFLEHAAVRQRYWYRSMLGWPTFHQARPNLSHEILATLEEHKIVSCVITQNVDGLHLQSGSRNVIELHGSLANAICLSCGQLMPRADIQELLLDRNPSFQAQEFSPGADGDATPHGHSKANDPDAFQIINCPTCDGLLKPDVVFYGENVPVSRVSHCMEQLSHAGMLLCLGTSLTVFSGFRFCRAAHRANQPVAIVNLGATRADEIATCTISHDCASVLNSLLAEI